MWPNAKIAVMGGEHAAGVIATVSQQGRQVSEAELTALKQPLLDQFARQSDPYYSTERLWDDGIIDPRATRDILGLALSLCAQRTPEIESYGLFRM
jgi:3-methylcrotonyl-CoA carboxylase beta subunit